MLRVGSLFSGIGGIELGLERTGYFRTSWFVETDPYARAVLRKHWPDVPIYGDITHLKFERMPKVDVITGGFPCQNISQAGDRKGLQGKKSGLWKEMLRAIRILRPRYALIENVSALTHRGLSTVLADLATCRYDAEWDCLPAAAIGAPHRRDRIFILAYPSRTRKRTKPQRKHQLEQSSKALAHANSQFGGGTEHEKLLQPEARPEPARCSPDVPDANRPRYSAWFTGPDGKISLERYRERTRAEQWAAEPSVGRMAYGIPRRMDRIRCLGNAVVPQVAQFIGLQITKKEELTYGIHHATDQR